MVACKLAFIACKMPGSNTKENCSAIGAGLAQSADQVVNITEPRGFSNIGADDGWIFTALSGDDTGGIIWPPAIPNHPANHGLHPTKDNMMADTEAGTAKPAPTDLPEPLDPAAHLRPDHHARGLGGNGPPSGEAAAAPACCARYAGRKPANRGKLHRARIGMPGRQVKGGSSCGRWRIAAF
jgi:hypothetical protein